MPPSASLQLVLHIQHEMVGESVGYRFLSHSQGVIVFVTCKLTSYLANTIQNM